MGTLGTPAGRGAAIDLALLVCRLVVGIIFIAHGSQKLFGLFGGPGLSGMTEHMGPVLGPLVSIGEFFGGVGLLTGLLSRFSAFWIIVIMLGAIVKVHGKNGFFLGEPPGYEYCLALIGLAATILIAGPGAYAFSRVLPAGLRKWAA